MKTIITSAIMMASVAAFAQNTQSLYLTNDNKTEVVRNLASSQYGPSMEYATNENIVKVPYVFGDDKYLKTTEEGTRYSTFQVYEISGKDKSDVMVGLLTGSLDRDTRYNELGQNPEKIEVAQTDVEVLQVPAGNITTGMTEKVAGFKTNGKYFVILGEGDYRYIDGKAISGDKNMMSELKKGKPITAITFFYELQKAGLADKTMSVKQFLNLTTNEQQEMVNSGSVATN